jgi:hypothetical protein
MMLLGGEVVVVKMNDRYKWHRKYAINPFAITKKADKNLEQLKLLYALSHELTDNDSYIDSIYNSPKELHEDLHIIDFAIQKIWGVKEDINYHKFWRWPFCDCPVLDNMEVYPYGPYIYNGNSEVHGN